MLNFRFSIAPKTQLLLIFLHRTQVLNIYIVNDFDKYAGKATRPGNYTVIQANSVLATTSVHEIGHNLGLKHTHSIISGIENIERDSSDSNYNCELTGDGFCSTPADPQLQRENLTFKVDTSCIYTAGETRNGLPYDPDTHNYMSYSRRYCRDSFTEEQGNLMYAMLQNEPVLQPVVSSSCVIPELTGPDFVCNSSNSVFTLQNEPNNVIWSSSSKIAIVSQTNSTVTVKASSSTSRGEGFVTATYNNGVEATKDVWVGKPYNYADAVDPICTNQYSQEYTLKASPGASSYRLVSTSPNLLINFSNEVTFTDAPKKVYFSSTSDAYYQVNLYTTNECGTTQGIIYVRSESCTGGGGGMYSVYPNPASSEVNIASNTGKTTAKPESQSSLYQQTRQIAKLFDFNGAFVKDIELDPYGTTKMDVSNLKEGFYFLKIQAREEEETHKIIVSH